MKSIKIAINGFGRIGRLILRSIIEKNNKDISVIAINDLAPADTSAHLLKYDSIHGVMNNTVKLEESMLKIEGHSIQMLSEKNPESLPWKKLGIDIVMECSGIFATKEKSLAHVKAGAKKVIISAPGTDVDATVVYGVNHNILNSDHVVISNASCTTNCLAPVIKVINDNFGFVKGYMTTIHAYTGDQKIIDTAHKDLRRARAGAVSMIPTSTGAARAVGLVIKEVAGKLDGCAIRVPTPNVSMIDLTFQSKKKVTTEDINNQFLNYSKGDLHGILGYNTENLVSVDFNHSPYSSIFDATQTQVIKDDFCRVVSWYDNEWGFSNRMVDVARYFYNNT
jgi:glyceraldehyde 3-phosphate dehydrogenase